MKKWLLLPCLCLVVYKSDGQKVWAKKGEASVIVDPVSHHTYVLDTAHLYVSAYDSKGKLVWKSFTKDCNYDISENGLPKPISGLELKTYKTWTRHRYIWTKVLYAYHCICWGYFDLSTGKYHTEGCD